jgi:hypothetical protein
MEQSGGQAGMVRILKLGVSRIGRDEDNDIAIKDSRVSRRHAEIRWDGMSYALQDLNSRNGTFVNGSRVTTHTLRNRDRISLADTVLLFISGIETEEWVPAIRFDIATGIVSLRNNPIDLTKHQFRAFTLLYMRRGELVQKDELSNHVWREEAESVSKYAMEKLIQRLRQKLGDDPEEPRYLHTVRGIGYKLLVY